MKSYVHINTTTSLFCFSHQQLAQAIIFMAGNLLSILSEIFSDPFPITVSDLNLAGESRCIKHYSNSHRILLVGEGDFSFSACLAKAFGSAANMVATSLDSFGFLMENYKCALTNIRELEARGCNVMHGIDATTMACHGSLAGMRFDRIVFNFPHAGFVSDESRSSQIARHQRLIKSFFENAKQLLANGGEIHVTHKSYCFFLEWEIEILGISCGLRLREEAEFRLGDYEGYNNKYGFGGDRDFNCQPSKTYKFFAL